MTQKEALELAGAVGTECANQLHESRYPKPDNPEYGQRRELLESLYKAYHKQPPAVQAYLQKILVCDKKHNPARNWRDDITDSHNTFVMRHIAPGAPTPFKRIAVGMGCSVSTATQRVERTLDRLMPYVFGVDGLDLIW
jgi:hypothetical protein